MARQQLNSPVALARRITKKKTSQGGNNAMKKLSSMNKSTKRGYKKYRGQGR